MKLLVTGHDGYIGSVFTPMARSAGHDVTGLDAFWFEGCTLGPEPEAVSALRLDVRDAGIGQLRGFDAVVHLAAISNDPVGHLDPARTYEINHLGSARIARLAKRAGVERFIFASSCSLYGAASLVAVRRKIGLKSSSAKVARTRSARAFDSPYWRHGIQRS